MTKTVTAHKPPGLTTALLPGKDKNGTPYAAGDTIWFNPRSSTTLAGELAQVAAREYAKVAEAAARDRALHDAKRCPLCGCLPIGGHRLIDGHDCPNA